MAFAKWAKAHRMAIQILQPCEPNQNADIVRVNHTYREEFLNVHLFARLEDGRAATWRFMIDYN